MATLDELINCDLITVAGHVCIQTVNEKGIVTLFEDITDDLACALYNDVSLETSAFMNSGITWIYQDGDTVVFDVDYDDYIEQLR